MSQAASIDVPAEAAEQTQRQQQREQLLREQQEIRPNVRLKPSKQYVGTEVIPEKEDPCFQVNEIKLVGDSAEKFQFALVDVINKDTSLPGRCLGVQGINAVITRLQNIVVGKGYVTTRILAAPQDLKTGVLELTIIPGRIKDINFRTDGLPESIKNSALPINEGEILNLRAIEQALENFRRLPSADADFKIEPSKRENALPGESDLVIEYKQESPLRVTLLLDDGGSRSTGRNQAGLTISYDNLLSVNDLFYLSLNHDAEGGSSNDKGTKGFTAHYSFPIGYWLFSAIASKFEYRQTVNQAAQDISFSGESRSGELQLSRVVYRDASRKVTALMKTYLRSSRNFIDGVEIELQHRRTAGWVAGIADREFIGASTLDVSVEYKHGTGAFNVIAAPEDPFGEGSSRPSILNANIGLNIPFVIADHSFRYFGNLRYQQNYTPLVPQDRFNIGGRYTVRGFDGESVLSADRGWLIRNDIAFAYTQGHEAYFGVDYGEVDGQASRFLLGQHLAGEVLGLRGQYKKLNYDLFVGQPLSKPKGFRTGDTVAGFNLSWTF